MQMIEPCRRQNMLRSEAKLNRSPVIKSFVFISSISIKIYGQGIRVKLNFPLKLKQISAAGDFFLIGNIIE